MKLLKIENNLGYFCIEDDKYITVDKITKEHLLKLVNLTLSEEIELDEYDEVTIANPAHQIVYKNIYEKLDNLKGRKQEFLDESETLYLEDYERYKQQSETI